MRSEEDMAFDALPPIERVRMTVDAYRQSIGRGRVHIAAEYQKKGLEAHPADLWDLGRLDMLDRIAAVMDDRGLVTHDMFSEQDLEEIREEARREERHRIIRLLQRLAAGRLEYTKGNDPHEQKVVHVAEWGALEAAARAVTDPGVVLQMVPSWLWTEDEIRAVQDER